MLFQRIQRRTSWWPNMGMQLIHSPFPCPPASLLKGRAAWLAFLWRRTAVMWAQGVRLHAMYWQCLLTTAISMWEGTEIHRLSSGSIDFSLIQSCSCRGNSHSWFQPVHACMHAMGGLEASQTFLHSLRNSFFLTRTLEERDKSVSEQMPRNDQVLCAAVKLTRLLHWFCLIIFRFYATNGRPNLILERWTMPSLFFHPIFKLHTLPDNVLLACSQPMLKCSHKRLIFLSFLPCTPHPLITYQLCLYPFVTVLLLQQVADGLDIVL